MCWNASVSLNTFMFSTFVATLGLYNSIFTISAYLFVLSFVFMQLTEYFIWTYISNPKMNRKLSQLGLLLILSQPIFAILSCEKHQWILPMLLSYIAFLILLFMIKPWSSIDFRSIPAKSGHLSWKWLSYSWILIFIYLFFHTLVYAVEGKWLSYGIMVGLVGMIYFLYHSDLTWGTMWCFISNGFAFYWLYLIFRKDWCLQKGLHTPFKIQWFKDKKPS